jgi:rubrerythrin
MFTKQDFIAYFSELEMIERNMRDLYAAAAASVDDPELRRTFTVLGEAEVRHEQLVEELRQLAIRESLKGEKD